MSSTWWQPSSSCISMFWILLLVSRVSTMEIKISLSRFFRLSFLLKDIYLGGSTSDQLKAMERLEKVESANGG